MKPSISVNFYGLLIDEDDPMKYIIQHLIRLFLSVKSIFIVPESSISIILFH
ncbi:hypothetical protein SOVF_099000 [Spinacia oleracea]|nr:hypothetical protein SOVF_099000 [Spinacia oleracea]